MTMGVGVPIPAMSAPSKCGLQPMRSSTLASEVCERFTADLTAPPKRCERVARLRRRYWLSINVVPTTTWYLDVQES